MRPRLDALLRSTTFRLAIVQAGVVLAFVVGLLLYVYLETAGQLIRDSDVLADQEYASLERAYAEGGIRRLNQEVVERAARPGPLLYVLAESSGAIITGDFQQLPALPGEAAERVDFNFDRADDNGSPKRGRARGREGRLLGGPILLVARDLGDTAVIAGRITRALWTVAIIGIGLSVVSGLLAAWQASRRAEALANTARDVMAGDLTRRAPVSGLGDEFDVLAESLNAMLDRIEQLMHATRTAGDSIAHDLRSPLTRFRQKLEVALEAPPNSDADREALRKAVDEADRLHEMFNAIMRLARVEATGNWKLERVEATPILRELVEFYEPAAEEQGLTLRGDVGDHLVVRGDQSLFTQAVSNLIENALKYTQSGGHVELRAQRRADGRIEIDVLDDGPGIAPADRDRVLDRFVRLEGARSTPGAGLGLSLVAAVARLHRGGLHLRDGLENGDHKGLGAALVLPALDQAP
ncbi:MAG TPA: HAMP domain-containing sensor histidine kinase [Vitreimonas sp.]|jgi:signal transduction histidine kinase|nr:HAMP domain-containing sensor histidine kinase [Vitreimonas sp.]